SLHDALRISLKELSFFQWLILISTGLWGCLGHLLQIQAYQRASASLLAPFVYLQIVAAAALGWLIWGQFPDVFTWIGIAVVCTSGIVIGLWSGGARTDLAPESRRQGLARLPALHKDGDGLTLGTGFLQLQQTQHTFPASHVNALGTDVQNLTRFC